MAFTSGNDQNILQATDSLNVGAGAGNDKYILAANNLSAGQIINITDANGANTLQLIGGLAIASSVVAANALQLTLSNGAVVNVFGADNFSYEVGGNPLTGTAGVVQSFPAFVTTSLGAPAVPTTGTANGTPNGTVNADGTISFPVVNGPVGNLFTLAEPTDTPAVVQQALMWGYTPTLGGVTSGAGIPVADLQAFVRSIAGIDLFELGLIDSNGVEVAGAIRNITIADITSLDSSTLTLTLADGSVVSAEASLGRDYLAFLGNLIFDNNGNSRLYMGNVVTKEAVIADNYIWLTPTKNNGGTLEPGLTTVNNDILVAGRTELLHKAYLDGGAGYDTLSVDMKGVYAQPLQVLNIEQINVQNLPNVYTTISGSSSYPNLSTSVGQTNSFLDLSHATSLQKLVVTEGGATAFGGLGGVVPLGDLSIVGIRANATTRLEGGFTQTVNLSYGQGQTGAVNLELLLGDTQSFNLNVAHNASVLNIDSQGYENYLQGVHFFNNNSNASLARINISGEGALFIQELLDGDFRQNRTATVDAHANTGGVQLGFHGQSSVNFIGSSGNDKFTSLDSSSVIITSGVGNNEFITDRSQTVNITSLNGNDTIHSTQSDAVTINAGGGNNTVVVSANTISIATGAGNDKVTISGEMPVDSFHPVPAIPGAGIHSQAYISTGLGAVLTVDVGAGNNTVVLGRDDDAAHQYGVTALEGSSITGSNIALYVENNSDLSQASLTGVTSVTLKEALILTSGQFAAIGSAAFKVDHSVFGATQQLHIVVDHNVTLSSLVNLATLDTHVRLSFDLREGATLTLSAAELSKYVSWHGIDSTDGLNGKVVITDAGLNFDAFDSGNDYQVSDGGSLTDNFAASTDVTIIRTLTGFERPAPTVSSDVLTIDSTGTVALNVTTAIISEVATLKIIGNQDVVFTSPVDLGRDAIDGAHPALNDGRAPDWAAPETDAYTIDFSALTGKVQNLTVANFQDVKQIKGNGSATNDVRLNVELTDGGQVGSSGNANGLKSSGVQTYVVTAIGDDSVGEDAAASAATFYVCDLTKDVTMLGLRGNYNDTINFKQVNWGTNFLLEGGGAAKADGNPSYANIGNLHAEYFWEGTDPQASATVNIVNLDTGATIRPLHVAGIDIDYADTLAVKVAGPSNLVVETVGGNSVNNLTFTATGNVTVRGDLLNVDTVKGLQTLNASAVDGIFTLQLSNATTTDLSKTVVTGLEKVVFDANNAALTLTVDQALALTAANVTTSTGVTNSTLNFADLGNQAIDMTAFGAKNIGTVSIADDVGLVTLAATTVLGNALNNADSLLIKASLNDTSVEMTAVQFNQLAGSGTVASTNGTDSSTGLAFKANLIVTDLTASTQLDFAAVDQSAVDVTPGSNVAVTVRVNNVVATSALEIKNGIVTLDVTGNVDLTKAVVANIDAIDFVKLAAGSVLTLTAAQVQGIGLPDLNADGIADNWTALAGSKLNITGISDGFNLNLTMLEKAGIDIGTLTLTDSNAPITLGPLANLANADSIVTPTKAVGDATEATTLKLSATQFNQLAGTGTITGDAQVSITGLANNTDSNGDNVINTKDTALIDVTGITAPKGTVDLGTGVTTVTLDAASSLAGFEIKLDNGQMIRFNTVAQASGATITEKTPGSDVTAVAWLFTSAATPIDTSKYNSSINHLFILNALVDGKVEESLWTTLAGSIVVEKFSNSTIPDVLTGYARVNTFEALTSVPGDINYDNQTLLESTTTLTLNLEGNTTLGNVTVGDTVGTGLFQSMTINSYEDRTSLAARGLTDNGFVFEPNKIGNISLNTGSADNLVNVTLSTANGYADVVNVNAVAATRAGLALEVGTITFAATATVANPTTPALLTLNGENNITIAGVNISDAEVNLLDINAAGYTGIDAGLKIGGIVPTGGADATNALGSFDHIYVVDGYTAPDAPFGVAGNNLLVVAGGTNDLSKGTGVGNIDQVHFTANGTLTLTGAQVAAISTTVDADNNGTADAWSALAGLNVKLNIVGMDGSVVFDLAKVAAAGIDIGTITMAAGVNALNVATTLGDADSIIVPGSTVPGANVLTLTAAQFEQLAGAGTITTTGVNGTQDLRGVVNIDSLNDAQGSIDLTGVTAKNGTIKLDTATVLLGGTDVALTAAAKLGDFSVTLVDLDTSLAIANELAGQTIRFATGGQAERAIIVEGVDDNGSNNPAVPNLTQFNERDTNVIWNFNAIAGTVSAGKIDTSKYGAGLGRVWVNDALVNGQNVESIFSSPSAVQANPTTGTINLNSSTIIRVANTGTLGTVLPTDVSVNRTVEVDAFTSLPLGLIFNNPDKLVDVENLTFDLGGAVTLGPVSIDDTVAASISNDNEFGTLTINSLLADSGSPKHYLLPESWVNGVNPLPTAANVIGNIGSGATRDELARVTINATGVGLNTGTITFTDNGDLTPTNLLDDDPTAVLTVTGNKNVNITSVNSADAAITAVNVVTTGYTGVLTAPGASPAFALNNTQTLTFTDADVDGTITLGRDASGAVTANAGVAGDELSFINAGGYNGTLNLGIIAQIDSTNDTADLNGDGDLNDLVGTVQETRAFTFTSGQGITTATLAAANGLTPTLNAGSEWSFDYTGADAGSYLKITASTVFQAGSTLRLNNVPLIIEGLVNLAVLVDNAATTSYTEGLFITGGASTLEVQAGATLTLTAGQVNALNIAGVNIVGAGTLKVTGDASNLTLGANIKTVGVDISAVTLIALPLVGADADATVNLTGLTGATVGATANLAQTIIGSGNADAITTTGIGADIITGGAGNDTLNGGAGNDTYNVDSGTDTIVGLATGDIVVVSGGATANASVANDFAATAATVNNGIATLTDSTNGDADGNNTSTIDVSLATGSNGFSLIGSTLTLGVSSDTDKDVLIGGSKADLINGGNTNQSAASMADTLTGNGGADVFEFNVGTTIPVALASLTTQPNLDREQITVTAGGAGAHVLSIAYDVNGVVQTPLAVNLTNGADATLSATQIAAAFSAVSGFTALSAAAVAVIQGANGTSLDNIVVTDLTAGPIVGTWANNVDVAQIQRINVGTAVLGQVHDGETYTVTTTLAGSAVATSVPYTAAGGDAEVDVANQLVALINGSVVGVNATASLVGGVWGINITDTAADNGGFTVSALSKGGFAGSGASNIGGTDFSTADVITDFVTGVDKVDLNLAAAVDATNYVESNQVATFNLARTAADAAMTGTVQYYLTSALDIDGVSVGDQTSGLLFFDANLDGTPDGVILLTGITSANFAAGDIQV